MSSCTETGSENALNKELLKWFTVKDGGFEELS